MKWIKKGFHIFFRKGQSSLKPMSVEQENSLMLEMLKTVLYEATSDFDRERNRVRCWPISSKTHRWIGQFLRERGYEYPYGRSVEDIKRSKIECVTKH